MAEDNTTLPEAAEAADAADPLILSPWLCGPDSPVLWNHTQSWTTSAPDFSSCFRRAAFVFPPVLLFWLLLPIELRLYFRSRRRNIPFGRISLAKTLAVAALVVLAAVDLARYVIDAQQEGQQLTWIEVLDPSLRLLTFLTLLALLTFQRRRGRRISAVQFLFWLAFLLASVVNVYVHVKRRLFDDSDAAAAEPDVLESVAFGLTWLLLLFNFLLHFFVEAEPKYAGAAATVSAASSTATACPSTSASFPSHLVFAWFTSLAWTGFKRSLTADDLWDLPPIIACRYVVPRFNVVWERVVGSAHLVDVSTSFNKTADAVEVRAGAGQRERKPISIFPLLTKCFGRAFFFGSLLKFVHDCMVFVAPNLLRVIIAFAAGDSSTHPMWQGVFWAGLLLLTTIVQSVVLSQYFYKMYIVGLWIRTSVISAIYRKSLRVSAAAKKDVTTGEIVNLMSVDVQRVVDIMPYINMLWSSPMQISLAIFFLWQQLGPSVLAGLLVMVLLIPINGVIAAKSRTFNIKMMKKKDQRIKMMNEILQGMKILKLYAWEPSFRGLVTKLRDEELTILKQMAYLQSGTSFTWSCAPFLVSLVSFATFVLVDEDNVLDSQKAFVSLSLFNILRFPLSMLPMMITGMVQASVSIKRMNKFLNSDELNEGVVERGEDGAAAIEVEDASFTWDGEDKDKDEAEDKKDKDEEAKLAAAGPTLKNLSFRVQPGQLVAVVGTVGAGKSSLVASLLGEMQKQSGRVRVRGSVAFVAQQAWIQNATVKENVLFSRAMNERRYQDVLDECALRSDLDQLMNKDDTEIGEKGINLSGGQKQRISLARAVYSDADIYLLDDPLSAVDAHVSKHIFSRVVGPGGCLGKKTRLLVTHGVSYLPQMDNIIVVKDGAISEMGTYKELLQKKGAFAEFLVQYFSEAGEHGAGADMDEEADDIKHTLEAAIGREELQRKIVQKRSESESRDRTTSVSSSNASTMHNKSVERLNGSVAMSPARQNSTASSREGSPRKTASSGAATATPSRQASVTPASPAAVAMKPADLDKNAAAKQYQEEKMESGRVGWGVYYYYIRSMGYCLFGSCVLFFTIYQVCSAASSVWLSRWSDIPAANQTYQQRDLYLGVYGGLGLLQAVATVFASLGLYLSTLSGAKRLHRQMLANLLRSPMAFFDTTPQGRILNRFSKDVDVLDTTMPGVLRGWITCLLGALSTFFIITYTTPVFIFPILIILAGYYVVQRIYVASSRQLKRLESVSRSPIYSHFGETVSGITTIRAYGLQSHFISQSETRVDDNLRAAFPGVVANRWLAIRLETVGNVIIFCAALLAVLARDTLTPGLVGLSLSYALSVTQTLNWLVRMTSEVETNIVAVERMKEYSETPTEAEWESPDGVKPGKEWPGQGRIVFDSYSTKYRKELNNVLNDLSFDVPPGNKVGIVGRTGAGKSSLTLALFRLIESSGGRIEIDGVDISTLGLHDLRSKLTIIPQDPVLFSGTLRLNLDPFETHGDERVWQALELAHLKPFVAGLADGLDHAVAEGGENLSVGQRQLVCLARALLRKTRVLVLDEATAAVDMETDELIQQTIKKEFSDGTVITIAHRLNTIIDYDKILVLQEGRKVEYDAPKTLLENQESIFFKMCQEAGLV